MAAADGGVSPAALAAQVRQLLQQGRAREAGRAWGALCERFPAFAPGWHLGSLVAQQLGHPDKALACIEQALTLEPGSAQFLLRRAALLQLLERTDEARAVVAALARWPSPSPALLADLGAFHSGLGEHERALAFYQRALAAAPDHARYWFDRAVTERFLGRAAASERSYDEGLRRDPRNGEAYWLRAGLRRQTEAHNHVAELEAQLAAGGGDWLREVQLRYALAKECEDLGRHDDAFAQLKRGADLRRAHLRYRVDDDVAAMAAIASTWSAATLAGIGGGHDSLEPIFVVGLPRSGTTLVERILGSHSAVTGAGELNQFALALTRELAAGGAPPAGKLAAIAASPAVDFTALGRRYLDSTRPLTGRTPHFVDKMPLNYLYCGLIAKALPDARIIELMRDPLDSCYALYKQLFTVAYPFSYDLDDIFEYYVGYRRLMAHWHRVLPGRILRVGYEQLVADQAGATRRLLAHCGLPWEDGCLAFERNRAASTTASALQVREKIYRSSLGKWRCYRRQLQPLLERLQRAGYVDAHGEATDAE